MPLRRFLPRFSLKLALAAFTAITVLIWLFLHPSHRTRRQEETLARFPKGYQHGLVAWEPAGEPWRGWVEQATGTECRNVVGITLPRRCSLEDADELLRFPYLQDLDLAIGITDDAVLEKVSQLSELESLQVMLWLNEKGESKLNHDTLPKAPRNEGVRHLAKLTKLRQLRLQSAVWFEPPNVWHRYVDDEGLGPVLAVAPLELLNVGGSNITMKSLRPLLARGTLRHVCLPESFAADVDELLAVPSLQTIGIRNLSPEVRARDPKRLVSGSDDVQYHWSCTLNFERYPPRQLDPFFTGS